MQALLLPGGDISQTPPATIPFKGTLEEVNRLFDCRTIQVIATPIPRLAMLVDEDAAITGRPKNYQAMLFYRGAIFGPALLTYFVRTEEDLIFQGVPAGFDWKMVGESSYQRIVAKYGEHSEITLDGV